MMEQEKGEGLARYIGAPDFKVSDLEEILPGVKIIPSVNQICRDHLTLSHDIELD